MSTIYIFDPDRLLEDHVRKKDATVVSAPDINKLSDAHKDYEEEISVRTASSTQKLESTFEDDEGDNSSFIYGVKHMIKLYFLIFVCCHLALFLDLPQI